MEKNRIRGITKKTTMEEVTVKREKRNRKRLVAIKGEKKGEVKVKERDVGQVVMILVVKRIVTTEGGQNMTTTETDETKSNTRETKRTKEITTANIIIAEVT